MEIIGYQATGNTQAYAVLNYKGPGAFTWSAFYALGGNAPYLAKNVGDVQGFFVAVGY